MTPEQLREAIADNSVDSAHNSYGHCRHGTSFALHCGKCEMEQYSISQRSPGWFERQAREVPERLIDDICKLRDHRYGKWDVRAKPERRAFRRDDPLSEDWTRHTVDIQQPPPQHIEDDSLAVERGEWWAKVVWMVLGVAFVVYVVVRIWVGGGQ